MLSLFPQLFTYSELAPLILRFAAAFIVIGFGYPKLLKPSEYRNFAVGLIEFCSAIFLIAGFLTQLAAALIILAMIYEIVRPEPENLRLKILLIAALGSLALLGPGLFSIDLPL
ncbi:MAG: hypothetical protein A3A10_02425 [Candidatus Tagabacteria bacterium RIFCSPLOWO2_01_FULL_42_9]|uniref:TQO small subunit DoxD domain-containing protein n=1 Tax=Candidatus Tagabacteria bacterium RIFCSPLOWO2_01_FULL_42_9 TaxID=1802296 RepID=A0A1G2LVN7_9BACT|nr:MAG: hypothetical protein A3A10_02425 [Candidatus Tagabacteria bacterium RIFCSPLOWO2_01_FULL_42_9]